MDDSLCGIVCFALSLWKIPDRWTRLCRYESVDDEKGAWMMAVVAVVLPPSRRRLIDAECTVQLARLCITLVFPLLAAAAAAAAVVVVLFSFSVCFQFISFSPTDSFSFVSLFSAFELLWLLRLVSDGRAEATCRSHDYHHYLCKTCHPTSTCCFAFSNGKLLWHRNKERSTRYFFLIAFSAYKLLSRILLRDDGRS